MPLLLRDILALDVLQPAHPEVVHGHGLLDRPVRWVHTSELIEAAALLKGQELLLTTGLGLEGRGPIAQRSYVEKLVQRGAAALVLELGWTFPTVPDGLLQGARTFGLPLVALHEIVPFVEITEQIQTRIVHEDVDELTAARRADEVLDAHAGDGGIWGLVEVVADQAGCAAILESGAGHVVAWAGLDDDTSPDGVLAAADDLQSTAITRSGARWGSLHLVNRAQPVGPFVATLLRRVGQLLSTMLQGSQREHLPLAARLRHDFLEDLVRGHLQASDRLRLRTEAVGLVIPPSGQALAFVLGTVAAGDHRRACHAAQAAASARGGFAGSVDGDVVGLVTTPGPEPVERAARDLIRDLDRNLRQHGGTRGPRVAIGNPVSQPEGLATTMRDARSALELARELRLPDRTITASGIDVDRVLAIVVDEPVVNDLVAERLGPLITHGEHHGPDLIETLRVYLEVGSSKTAAATTLGIQRQTIYQRLARIQELIGPVDRPRDHTTLVLALAAHRLQVRQDGADGLNGRHHDEG